METPLKPEKKAVPQIELTTGLSHDYFSECSQLAQYDVSENPEAVEYLITDLGEGIYDDRGFIVQPYEAKYPESVFKDVVTNNNRKGVEKIREEVKRVNTFYAEKVKPLVPKCKDGALSPKERTTLEEFAKILCSFLEEVTKTIKGKSFAQYKKDTSK